jgi:hypothetical protein
VPDDHLVHQRPDRVLIGRVLREALNVYCVATEEYLAQRDAHRDRLGLAIRERHLQAV